MDPVVSVVVPSYNRANVIAQSLDSALAQTYPRLEIIVVDDGSTDETEQAVAPYRDRVVFIRQQNQGLAGARNTGLARATGEYVAWLDSDDLWNPDKLALQIAFLRRHPDHVLVASDFSAFDEDGYFDASHARAYYAAIQRTPGGLAGIFPHLTMLATRGLPYVGAEVSDPVRVYHGDVHERLMHGNCLHPPTVVFRRAAAARAGVLDKAFRSDVDWEYLLRLSRLGAVAYVDRPLMRYRLSPDQMSSDRHLAEIAASRVLVLESLAAREPALLRRRDFRRRLGFAQVVAAHALADGQRRPAARHLLESLRMGYLDAHTARALVKLCLPGSLVASYRRWSHRRRAE